MEENNKQRENQGAHDKLLDVIMEHNMRRFDGVFNNLGKGPGDEPEWSEDADKVKK